MVGDNKETPNLTLDTLRTVYSDLSKLNVTTLTKVNARNISSAFGLKFNFISTQLINSVISKKQDTWFVL